MFVHITSNAFPGSAHSVDDGHSSHKMFF